MMRRRIQSNRLWMIVGLIVLFYIELAASAAMPAPFGPRDREEFASRRARVYEQIGDGVAVILADTPHVHAVKFRQSPDFYYLTGIEEPSAVLVLVGGSKESYVFAYPRSPGQVRVEGPGLLEGEKPQETYGLTQALPLDQLLTTLQKAMGGAKKLYLPVTPPDAFQMARGEMAGHDANIARHPLYRYTPLAKQAVLRLREIFPSAEAVDINPMISRMRLIKSPYEIERMRRAGQIGAEGMKEAIRVTRPGMFEYELEASIRYIYTKMGSPGGFTPIVASGPNMVVWHYQQNSRKMEAGDLVLIDAGADSDYYASDITRTWPISGKFTPEQEKMYRCVLEARDAIIAVMKPGVTIKAMQDAGEEIYKRYGYQKEFQDLGRYVGHWVGLSVHDVGSMAPATALEARSVFNVEPILEIPARKIHIRLEDTILVTATGAENMTAGVPVKVDELSALMKK